MRARLGHPDCALSGGDAVEVSLGSDAHGGAHRLGELPANLDRPLHLLYVLVVLPKEKGPCLLMISGNCLILVLSPGDYGINAAFPMRLSTAF